MSSSGKSASKILGLVTQARAEAFLLRLANRDLGLSPTPTLFETTDLSVVEKLREGYPEMAAPLGDDPKTFAAALPNLQRYLRLAWNSPDQRYREWYLHEMRRHYRNATVVGAVPDPYRGEEPRNPHDLFLYVDDRMTAPPAVTAFEAAAFYLQSTVRDRAKYCGHIGCREPYFIADKRSQKFCSEACAGPANRESKRLWWEKNRGKGAA